MPVRGFRFLALAPPPQESHTVFMHTKSLYNERLVQVTARLQTSNEGAIIVREAGTLFLTSHEQAPGRVSGID